MRLFLVIALLVWAAMHVYVFWRLSSVPVIARHVPRYTLAGLACLLGVSYIASRFLDHYNVRVPARVLETIGANWIGILFLSLVALLAVDLLTLFGWLLPRIAPSLRGWALIAGGILSMIALVQGHRSPVIEDYEVRLAALPAEMDGTVLVLASDFHLGTQLGRNWLELRIQQIQSKRPDIVVLGGDIVEGDSSSEVELLSELRKLQTPFGVWEVTGNHELDAERRGTAELEENGIHMLHDRWAEVRPGLILAGIDELTSRRHGEVSHFIEQALKDRPTGAATVFISHTPWGAMTAANLGAGLMLSGHTHDGQIWPFTYLLRLSHPWLSGRYVVNGIPIIVCRGTGTWGPRMRLLKRGEIVRITLRSPGVIRHESGATLSGALESRSDQPKDFIRRGGRPWDRAAQRGAQARNSP